MKSIHSFMILQTMDIRPIHTGADYKATLKEISALTEMDPAAGTRKVTAWISSPLLSKPTKPGTSPWQRLIR